MSETYSIGKIRPRLAECPWAPWTRRPSFEEIVQDALANLHRDIAALKDTPPS